MAVAYGTARSLELLIRDRANINRVAENGLTPLHAAIELNNLVNFRMLIAYGANVNARGLFGYPPLPWAVSLGETEMVNLLIMSGADTNIVDVFRKTARGKGEKFSQEMKKNQ